MGVSATDGTNRRYARSFSTTHLGVSEEAAPKRDPVGKAHFLKLVERFGKLGDRIGTEEGECRAKVRRADLLFQ